MKIRNFKEAEAFLRKELQGTQFENHPLVDWGGGDGEEDIKPFRIETKNDVMLIGTVFPEGGVEYAVYDLKGDRWVGEAGMLSSAALVYGRLVKHRQEKGGRK